MTLSEGTAGPKERPGQPGAPEQGAPCPAPPLCCPRWPLAPLPGRCCALTEVAPLNREQLGLAGRRASPHRDSAPGRRLLFWFVPKVFHQNPVESEVCAHSTAPGRPCLSGGEGLPLPRSPTPRPTPMLTTQLTEPPEDRGNPCPWTHVGHLAGPSCSAPLPPAPLPHLHRLSPALPTVSGPRHTSLSSGRRVHLHSSAEHWCHLPRGTVSGAHVLPDPHGKALWRRFPSCLSVAAQQCRPTGGSQTPSRDRPVAAGTAGFVQHEPDRPSPRTSPLGEALLPRPQIRESGPARGAPAPRSLAGRFLLPTGRTEGTWSQGRRPQLLRGHGVPGTRPPPGEPEQAPSRSLGRVPAATPLQVRQGSQVCSPPRGGLEKRLARVLWEPLAGPCVQGSVGGQ